MFYKPIVAYLAVGLVLGSVGCAAMVRTWQFSSSDVVVVPSNAVPPEGPVEIRLSSAKVKQKTVHVELVLANRGGRPARIDAKEFSLRLPDGTTLTGAAPALDQAVKAGKYLLSVVGLGSKAEPPQIAPGGTLEIEVDFRDNRRDLRRYPTLELGVDAISINGQPCTNRHITLAAPARAPMGQDI